MDSLSNKPRRLNNGLRPRRPDSRTVGLAWCDKVSDDVIGAVVDKGKSLHLPFTFRLSQLMGLYPCDANGPSETRIIWSTVVLTFHLVFFLSVTFVEFKNSSGSTLTLTWTLSFIAFARCAVIILHWVSYFVHRDHFRRVNTALRTFCRRDDPWDCVKTTSLIALLTAYYAFIVLDDKTLTAYNVIRYTELLTKDSSNFVVLRQFHEAIHASTNQIRRLNAKLTKEIHKSPEIVEDLLEKHNFFISLSVQSNELYSAQLLLISAFIFVRFVHQVYKVAAVKFNDAMSIVSGVILMCHASCLMLALLATAHYCEINKKEVDTFNSKLFKVSAGSPILSKNNKIRLYIEVKPTIEFTACNFFPIGYPLISSMLAAATTYVVIIVQFKKSDD